MKDKFELRIGMFAPTLEEQLKDFNITKEKINEWERIKYFIIRCHLLEKITDKQEHKLFDCLFKEIKNYIEKELKGQV